jgi:hypothetical protein
LNTRLEPTGVQLSDTAAVVKHVPIYPSDPNQILQITFNEYQNEIIQLQRQIIKLYQIFKML